MTGTRLRNMLMPMVTKNGAVGWPLETLESALMDPHREIKKSEFSLDRELSPLFLNV